MEIWVYLLLCPAASHNGTRKGKAWEWEPDWVRIFDRMNRYGYCISLYWKTKLCVSQLALLVRWWSGNWIKGAGIWNTFSGSFAFPTFYSAHIKTSEVNNQRHMYTYGWFMLMYGRNQHNIVKQLFSNWKINNVFKKWMRKSLESLFLFRKSLESLFLFAERDSQRMNLWLPGGRMGGKDT